MKIVRYLILLLFFSCADVQDLMPGMSYSDRTLIKGIRSSMSLSLEVTMNKLIQAPVEDGEIAMKREDIQKVREVLIRLNKEEGLNKIQERLNVSVKEVLIENQDYFKESLNNVKINEDPELLMENKFYGISEYYFKKLKWQEELRLIFTQKLKENGSLEEVDKLLALYNDIPYLDEKVEIDPVNTLADFLYFKIKQEIFSYEKEMRSNPLIRKTEVLQETFGDYD